MKACPRCIRAYSSLDIYCGSCGTIRCADSVPRLNVRFAIERRGDTIIVLDRNLSYHVSKLATFNDMEHAETFRNCLVALELGKLEDAL